MPILPKMPLKWFAKLNPKVDYEDLNNIVGNPEIDDIKWWLKLFDKNKEVFSVMVSFCQMKIDLLVRGRRRTVMFWLNICG